MRKGGNSQIDLERIYPTVLERELKEELDPMIQTTSSRKGLFWHSKTREGRSESFDDEIFHQDFSYQTGIVGLMKLGLLHHDKQDGNQFNES